MEDKVRLYYQVVGGLPAWDFCADAWLGARYLGIDAIPFEFIDKVPDGPRNIIVGSVEESTKWLQRNGYPVPTEIDITPTIGRKATSVEKFLDFSLWDMAKPTFIKPKGQIKAFTGTVVKSKFDAELVIDDYKGEIWVYDEVVDFISEWRVYIHKGSVRKIAHYRGDPIRFPYGYEVAKYVREALAKLSHYDSFTIDIGCTSNVGGEHNWTYLIEGNDGWAISNYGMEPEAYFEFVRDRWFQLTGLRP